MTYRTPVLLALSVALIATIAALAADRVAEVRGDLTPEDLARVAKVTAPTTDFSKAERFEAKQGGATTSTAPVNRDSFSHFSANLSFAEQSRFNLGNALFTKIWVPSPSSTQASDGLGPLFNARACQSCHIKDGRGHAPLTPEEKASSLFLRLSVPARTEAQKHLLATREAQSIPDPVYGGQLQNFAATGLKAEADLGIAYTDKPVTLADGTVVHLRAPHYSIDNPNYGPPDPEIMLSPRVAPQMIGLGLVEQIHPADILAHADPDDADGDGISGRPNWVRVDRTGEIVLGRFGWKASVPNVRQQTAHAFSGDMGISTPDLPASSGDCTAAQTACIDAPDGVQERLGAYEAPDPVMDLVTFYSQNLAVPQRRNVSDPSVLDGKKLFYSIGCTSCHTPKYVTRRDAPDKVHAFQLIWPYSDFLVHDMGPGLADYRPDGDASGTEWRTSPLWGIGLAKAVNGHTQYLHDGRARNLLEAILWHGGEAEAARDKVVQLSANDRKSLLAFLESL